MLLGMIFKICKFKKFCRADERKKPTFRLLLFKFCFPRTEFFKNGIYTHPIDLSCHQKFEKIHRPEAEILAREVGKYEKVTVD